jgi:hypothetical protein
MAALRDRDLPGTVNRVGRSDTLIRDYVPFCPRVCFLEEGHLNRWRFRAMLARIALLPLRTGSQAGGQSNAQEVNRVYNNRRFRGEKGNPRLYDPGSGCDFGIYWFAQHSKHVRTRNINHPSSALRAGMFVAGRCLSPPYRATTI